jgi:predicted DNA binding CopG/RHH family protein
MKSIKEFPFEKARRVTSSEVAKGKRAIEKLTGRSRAKRMGRPPKPSNEKFVPVSIRLHPLALSWLKKEAKKRSLPYQSIINEMLLKFAA